MGGTGTDEGKAELTVSVNETINVFSIASGHLYERFLRYNDLHRGLVCFQTFSSQDYDVECTQTHSASRQVLVFGELFVSHIQRLYSLYGRALWVCL